jgi:hypothetical protein
MLRRAMTDLRKSGIQGDLFSSRTLLPAVIAVLSVAAANFAASRAGAQQAVPSSEPPPVLRALPESGPSVDPARPDQARSGQDDPMAPNRPGFIDEVGKWIHAPSWGLPSIKSPQQTLEEWNKSARDATDNLTRMSRQQVVTGRMKCPVAANGAPDCKIAATKMCTEKGFKEGQSLDSDSAESCPAAVLLSGDKPKQRQACILENFVLRALCQ